MRPYRGRGPPPVRESQVLHVTGAHTRRFRPCYAMHLRLRWDARNFNHGHETSGVWCHGTQLDKSTTDRRLTEDSNVRKKRRKTHDGSGSLKVSKYPETHRPSLLPVSTTCSISVQLPAPSQTALSLKQLITNKSSCKPFKLLNNYKENLTW